MYFHCGSITEQNSTILQTEIETDGDKERETQWQAEIDRYRNRQK